MLGERERGGEGGMERGKERERESSFYFRYSK